MASKIVLSDFQPNFKQKRVRDPKYLKLIRLLPCAVTRNAINIEAAHISYVDLVNYPEKQPRGLGLKTDDCYVLPLNRDIHRDGPRSQHSVGQEEEWWLDQEFDPLELCAKLYNDGAYELHAMEATMREHHKNMRS